MKKVSFKENGPCNTRLV